MRLLAGRLAWRVALWVAGGLLTAAMAAAQTCPSAEEVRARLKIAYLDGMFVVGESSPGGKVLMRVAAYDASPGLPQATRIGSRVSHALQLARDILPRGSAAERAFIPTGSFGGATPEDRAASERAFLAACDQTMRELAPKPPFRFVIADRGVLGSYDARRGGVQIPRGPDYLDPTYFTDFLVAKPARPRAETDNLWPMSRAEADALFARLAASAPTPGRARQVEAVAIVEVSRIDPVLRTAEVELAAFALYDGTFAQKLYGYEPVAEARPPAPVVTMPLGPLPQGQYRTRQEATDRALALCEANSITATQVRCDCIAERAGQGWDANPRRHIYTILNEAVSAYRMDCANPKAQHAAHLALCATSGPPPGMLEQKVFPRLGLKKYCHCVADRALEIGYQRAMFSCADVSDYPVPADSPIPD